MDTNNNNKRKFADIIPVELTMKPPKRSKKIASVTEDTNNNKQKRRL